MGCGGASGVTSGGDGGGKWHNIYGYIHPPIHHTLPEAIKADFKLSVACRALLCKTSLFTLNIAAEGFLILL